MGRFWGLLFFLAPVSRRWALRLVPFNHHWLPGDVSSHGHQIDHLFNFIGLTGVVFIVTELLLFLVHLAVRPRIRNDSPAKFTHGSHNLEIIWTILPAATLLFIAIYQMNAWADVKMKEGEHSADGRSDGPKFEWRLRYPGPDGQLHTQDDIHHVNEMHIPVDEMVLINLENARRTTRFLPAALAGQARRRAGTKHSRRFGQGDQDRHVRTLGTVRALRPAGPLQDEGPPDDRIAKRTPSLVKKLQEAQTAVK